MYCGLQKQKNSVVKGFTEQLTDIQPFKAFHVMESKGSSPQNKFATFLLDLI